MESIVLLVVAIGMTFLTAALLSLPVMLLWDWLMPVIFGLPEITWLQAWGLLFLCGLLFRSHVKIKTGD